MIFYLSDHRTPAPDKSDHRAGFQLKKRMKLTSWYCWSIVGTGCRRVCRAVAVGSRGMARSVVETRYRHHLDRCGGEGRGGHVVLAIRGEVHRGRLLYSVAVVGGSGLGSDQGSVILGCAVKINWRDRVNLLFCRVQS